MTRYLLTGLLFLLPTLGVLAQDISSEATIEAVPEKPREMLYVTDQLRLSLYPEANDKSRRLEYLASGDKLGILEIKGPYAFVLTPTGKRGWVKRGFLLPQPTSKLLLEAEKKTNEALLQEIGKLTNSKIVIDQYERDMDKLTKNLITAEAAKDQAMQKVAEMEQAAREKAELEMAMKAIEIAEESESIQPIQAVIDTAKTYWQYLIPIFLFFLLLGSLISKMVIDARIKKRYHGLKLW